MDGQRYSGGSVDGRWVGTQPNSTAPGTFYGGSMRYDRLPHSTAKLALEAICCAISPAPKFTIESPAVWILQRVTCKQSCSPSKRMNAIVWYEWAAVTFRKATTPRTATFPALRLSSLELLLLLLLLLVVVQLTQLELG